MKKLLQKLKEKINLEDTIQFRIKDEFYELTKTKNKEWVLFTILGSDLKLNTRKLKGLEKEEVEDILKEKIKDVEIY